MVKIRILFLIFLTKLIAGDESVSSDDVETIDGVPLKQEVLGAIGEDNTVQNTNDNGSNTDNYGKSIL